MKARAIALAATASLAAPAVTSADQSVRVPRKRSLGHAIRIHRHRHRRHHRRHQANRAHSSWSGPWTSALASWYYDQGSTACGFHALYGFASLFLPCGTRVQMRGPGGTVVATMQDRGPYVAGRAFDLNPALKAALGCSDLCDVSWRRA